MNPKLQAIAQQAANDLLALVKDGEEKILDAWHSAEKEAVLNDTAPKFKFGVTVTLDLKEDKMQTDLTFGVRHKLTANCSMPDPQQEKLPLGDVSEGTVTIKTAGTEPVTVTTGQFSNIAKRLAAARKPH